jgi:predicted dehydrogenase
MADRIRVGIIGVGQIGKAHVDRYARVPDAEMVAVADINEAEAQRVAAQYGIPHAYSDFRQLLARDDIVAVDVCLHNNFHMPVTVVALEAGKHVYCEKPMAGSYADAATMLEAARRLDRMLSIQLNTLYSNETKAARALIERGLLGHVYHARSAGFRRRGRPFVDGYGTPTFVQKRNSAGGAMFDMGVYHVARMLYLLDNPEALRISGKTYQETPMDEERRARSGYDVEELGMGLVRLAGDVTLEVIESWAIHLDKFDGSYVVGSLGGVRLDPFGFFYSQGDLEINGSAEMGGFDWRIHNVGSNGDAYDSPEKHWIAALQGRVPLLPTAELALNHMLIAEGIYLSDHLGREVTADEVKAASASTAIAV